MDPHGRCSTFNSLSESQVCNGESLITVVVKEDMVEMTIVTTLYVEVKEDATKCSFRSFEVATTTYVKEGFKSLAPHLTKNT